MLGRLMGRGRSRVDARPDESEIDLPIVHETVPEEIFDTPRQNTSEADMSWMEGVPITEPEKQKAPEAAVAVPENPNIVREETTPAIPKENYASVDQLSNEKANPVALARKRCPHGWLVVVEGPGAGEWFVLESGVSHIGSDEGQTVQLDFGDSSVAPRRHAAVIYDEGHHAFQLHGDENAPIRLNGQVPTSPAMLRDGDIISIGCTSLRLVALCSQNFRWS
jgi:hypothetical protein